VGKNGAGRDQWKKIGNLWGSGAHTKGTWGDEKQKKQFMDSKKVG